MGMSIDESVRYLRLMLGGMKYAVKYWADKDKEESDIEQTNVEAVKTALDAMRKYQKIEQILKDIPLDQYENRLKAEKVAMLTEIQLEIEEVPKYCMTHDSICVYRKAEDYISDINKIIQQKINSLKEK